MIGIEPTADKHVDRRARGAAANSSTLVVFSGSCRSGSVGGRLRRAAFSEKGTGIRRSAFWWPWRGQKPQRRGCQGELLAARAPKINLSRWSFLFAAGAPPSPPASTCRSMSRVVRRASDATASACPKIRGRHGLRVQALTALLVAGGRIHYLGK